MDPDFLANLPYFVHLLLCLPHSRMSKGFPNLLVFRAVSWTTLSSTIAMIGLQIPFLMKFRGPALKKGFSGISVALNCAKFVFALVTYFLKASALAGASTTPDLDELKQWEHRNAKDNAQRAERALKEQDLGGGHKFFFNDAYSLESLSSSGLVVPGVSTDGDGGDDGDEMRYTMNPLFQTRPKERRVSEQVGTREESPEALTVSPLHRPEEEKPDASSDSDEEYISVYTSNPMLSNPMAIPSVKEREINNVQNNHSQDDDSHASDSL